MNRKEQILNEAYEIKRTLIQFLRRPMSEIKRVPEWPWPRLLALEVIVAGLTGSLASLILQKSVVSAIFGFFFAPFVTLITLAIMTLFFYYSFQIFAEKIISPRQIFTVVLFASIPQLILRIIDGYVPPITLVGMAFTAFLMLVGFVENFQIQKKMAIRLIGVLYAILLTIWIWNQVSSSRMESNWSHDRIEAPEVELGK
ncbi:MAG: YIP1 family protein [Pseudobdellovibrionaceae bacterium]